MGCAAAINSSRWDEVVSRSSNTSLTLDARFVRTRNALVSALRELLNVRPFDQISIREITGKAGVGYATFYRHYATKEALLHDVASAEVSRLIEIATPVAFTSSMRASVRTTCQYILERQSLWRAMLTGGASGILREQFIRQTVRLRGSNSGIGNWLPEDLHLTCATGATIDVLAWWLSQKPMPPLDDVVEMLDRLVGALTANPLPQNQ
jgi:AcrR family transcriptional regulator